MIEETTELTLSIDQEIEIEASAETSFDALIAQLSSEHETPSGEPLHLKLETWPGGRWYRDLGEENGHLWGHVQVIKRGKLLEIIGPLFMSNPVISHLQFRITEHDEIVRLTLKHQAVGIIDPEHRAGISTSWTTMLKGIKDYAERH